MMCYVQHQKALSEKRDTSTFVMSTLISSATHCRRNGANQGMEEHVSPLDMIECKACLQEKHISAFATYRRKSGEKAYRQVCKKCKNRREQARTSPLPLFSQDEMPRKQCRYCLEWKSDGDYD